MALLRWILGLLTAAAITIFAVANQQPVDVHWSPFHAALHLPLYLVVLGAMGFSFVAGSLIVWLNTIPLRLSARRQKKQIKNLEKRLDKVHVGEPVEDPSLPFLKG